MDLVNLKQKYLFVSLNRSSFLIRFKHLGHIWLFNCFEGCQHIMAKKKIKISQITKVIVSDLTINNISGLLGLLSSLSLNTKTSKLDVYGPKGLAFYLFLGRKYSQTYFRYKLLIHIVTTGLVFKENNFMLSTSLSEHNLFSFDYFLSITEMPGKFYLMKAMNYHIPNGPLYGKLKNGYNFVMPDGYILYGKSFTQAYNLGVRINWIVNSYNCTRNIFESLYYTTYLFDI